jgi:hypothetical protein
MQLHCFRCEVALTCARYQRLAMQSGTVVVTFDGMIGLAFTPLPVTVRIDLGIFKVSNPSCRSRIAF